MAKKKKSSKLSYKDPGPQEHDGYHVGQEVFCKCVSDGKLSYGAIKQIHLKTKQDAPCFTFICQMKGSYQLSYFDDIIDSPSQSQIDRRNRDRIFTLGALGGKIPRKSKKK
jgi:hypothetical protein